VGGGLDGFDDIMNDAEGMSQPEAVPQPLSHPREPALGFGSGYGSGRHMQAAFQPGAMGGVPFGDSCALLYCTEENVLGVARDLNRKRGLDCTRKDSLTCRFISVGQILRVTSPAMPNSRGTRRWLRQKFAEVSGCKA